MSNPVEKRPLLVGFISLVIGLTASHFAWSLLGLIPLLLAWRQIGAWTISAIFFVFGFFVAPAQLPILTSSTYFPGDIRVLSQPTPTAVDLRCDAAIGDLRVRLVLPRNSSVHLGDVLNGGALVGPVPETQEASYRTSGLQGIVRLKSLSFTQRGPSFFAYCELLRTDFDRFLTQNASPEEGTWVDALWFRAGSLPTEDKADLATSGAYSFVAASGLQVYLLFGLTTWLLGGVLGLDRTWQLGSAFLVLSSYLVVTGMHGNTFRACVTCLVLASAYLFKREPDLLSATAFAGILYLAFFPRSIYSLGFQLSMAIPIGLGLFNSWEPRTSLKGKFLSGFRMIAIVFLTGQPLIAEHTGHFGFGGVISGLILGLIAPVILGGAIFAYGASFVLPSLSAGLTTLVVVPLTSFFRLVVETIARALPSIDLPTFGTGWLVLYFSLWLLIWREREVKA